MRNQFLIICLCLSNLVMADTIDIKVKGMVCAFCASTMEKAFKENEKIDNVTVNLKNKLITLEVKSQQSISDTQIKNIVTNQGFLVDSIKREP